MDDARYLGIGVAERYLSGNLCAVVPGTVGSGDAGGFIIGKTYVQLYVRCVGHRCPPVCQSIEIGCPVACFPVDLGCDIVYPACFHPLFAVCVQTEVGRLGAGCGTARGMERSAGPDARRADTELYIGIDIVEHFVHTLYDQIHIVAPPVTDIGKAVTVGGKRGGIIEIRSWIKIIIHVDTVNIVFSGKFRRTVNEELPYLRQGRIEIIIAVMIYDPIRVLYGR